MMISNNSCSDSIDLVNDGMTDVAQDHFICCVILRKLLL